VRTTLGPVEGVGADRRARGGDDSDMAAGGPGRHVDNDLSGADGHDGRSRFGERDPGGGGQALPGDGDGRPHRPRLRGETADLRRDCSGDPRNGVVVGGPQRTVGPSCDPLGEAEARRNEFRYHPGGRDSPDRILGEVGEPKRAVRPGGDPGRFVDAGGGVGGDRPGGGDPPDRVALEVHTDDPASLADEAARVGARLESSPSALAALRSPAGLRFEAIA
jgi:hypothetical protein